MPTTLHTLIGELSTRSPRIAAMKLTASLPDAPFSGRLINFANIPADLDRVARAIEALVSKASLPNADAESAVRNVLTERSFYGQYCELGAYEWLDRHCVAFDAQIQLTGQHVLNPNGCTIDGRLKAIDAYFDIKGMGFQAYVAEMFREQLEKRLQNFTVTIEGAMDVAVKAIETIAFGQLAAIAKKLARGGMERIPQLGWIIRAKPPSPVTTTVHTENPYRLAEENRYFPFKTAGQFTRNESFVLIFAYAAQFNHSLFLNFAGGTDITLRSLARRVFLQLTGDPAPAYKFDDQVAQNISVADAARQISALLFINLDKDDAWMFLNPRAAHPMTQSHVMEMFDFTPPVELGVDDFAHDIY